MFFAASEDSLQGAGYDLVVDAARFADRHGLAAVWVPERHFTEFGFLYPNPAVLHAALARETRNLRLCAGSVVVPLHDPLRIAEEWAMVDRLSGGRVAISAASGWNPNDFAFFPERFAARREATEQGLELVRRLWRGEAVRVANGVGELVELRVQPRPVQPELPVWLTAAGSPETFARAGALGVNVLTHLLDHDLDAIAERVRGYRQARADAGHDPDAGEVTLMLHTFLGEDLEQVRELARGPYCAWLKANLGLLRGLALGRGRRFDPAALSPQDVDGFVGFLFDRFFAHRSLMGTPESCLPLLADLETIGVTEVACLLDFGPRAELILRHLPHLRRLMDLHQGSQGEAAAAGQGAPAGPVDDPLEAIRARCREEVPAVEFYRRLGRFGANFGPRFRGVERLWRRDGEAVGQIRLPEGQQPDGRPHPAFLDACFQVFAATLPQELAAGDGGLYLPAGLDSFTTLAPLPSRAWSHATLRSAPGPAADHYRGDVCIRDEHGRPLARAVGFRLQRAAEAPSGRAAGWLYELRWEPKPPAAGSAPDAGQWLILADSGGVGERLGVLLRERGDRCVVLAADQWAAELASSPDDLLGRALESPAAHLTVLHLGCLDATPPRRTTATSLLQDQEHGALALARLAQALGGPAAPPSRSLWLVTRGAQPAGPSASPLAVSQAPAWGVARTCAAEHPELWGGAVDLDAEADTEQAAAQLLDALLTRDGEDQVALRGGQRYVARLRRLRAPRRLPPAIHHDGAYLITGGLEGIGLEVAGWLVGQGARHLILLGRTALPPRAHWPDLAGGPIAARVQAIRGLEERGAIVHHAAIDVADERRLAGWLQAYRGAGNPPIRGVFHAAGVWRDRQGRVLFQPLARTTADAFRQMLPPKLSGAWLLQRLLAGDPVDLLVFLSSAAAIIGSTGQASYAAANAFLDALAQELARAGRRALALDLGPVTRVGFDQTPEGRTFHQLWERRGLKGLDPRDVLAALELLLGGDHAQVAVLHMDWSALGRSHADLLRAPWALGLGEGQAAAEGEPDLLRALREAPTERRRELLALEIQRQVALVMGFPPDETPDIDRGFFDLGMDSILALELKNRVQGALGREFPVTAVFDHPTIGALAGFLVRDVLGLAGAPPAAPAAEPDDLLALVEGLPDEEVARRVAQERPGG
jgi:natural product biosynthesis luciferase-like monooxygenase protein